MTQHNNPQTAADIAATTREAGETIIRILKTARSEIAALDVPICPIKGYDMEDILGSLDDMTTLSPMIDEAAADLAREREADAWLDRSDFEYERRRDCDLTTVGLGERVS